MDSDKDIEDELSWVVLECDEFVKEFEKAEIKKIGKTGKKYEFLINNKPVYLIGELKLLSIKGKKLKFQLITDFAKEFTKIEESILKCIARSAKDIYGEKRGTLEYVKKKYKKKICKDGVIYHTLKVSKYDSELNALFYNVPDTKQVPENLNIENFGKFFKEGDEFSASIEIRGVKVTPGKNLLLIINIVECEIISEDKDGDFIDSDSDTDTESE